MNKDSQFKQKILEGIGVKRDDQKAVSYSQYKIYRECPYQWSLTYKNKLYPFTSNINSVFGTAFHETVQEYVRLLYTVSVKASEEMDFNEYLSDRLIATYKEEVAQNNGQHFIPQEQLKEYYADGIAILEYLRRKRKVLFDYRGWELIAIELPLNVPILDGNDSIVLNGYLDLVLYNKQDNILDVPDFKTSTKGWSDYQKKDQLKMDQVLIYKHYLAKHYGIDPDTIQVRFFVVKRKVWENAEFPIPRHLIHIPAQGTSKVKLAILGLENFVKDVFHPDGTYQEKEYPRNPGSSCKFCPYNSSPELCSQKPGYDA